MTTWPILSVVTFLPLVGALLVYIVRGDDEATRRNSRWIALWTTLITFGATAWIPTVQALAFSWRSVR